ncbi:MAG TPA: transcriptional regulator [Bacteroidetes bacterium]|jgi:BlaI family transcriptional regulator, penicillinase repressor|nr:MAG: transcriptional regulator [Sphingobacteriales bacterium BACL12 MAG-120802-bin5]KRP11814.1 MAG: transcriptional regulator [Sphingobacteriales bacterium BACL12 MAG-120813-bin55]HCK20940.1 transcriptional regulator [Bacteroidota bacterium]
MKELTKAEEQVMQILWNLKKGFIKDILQEFDPPRPAYTTVSTIVRILETKGFIAHESFGKTHRYYPLVEREAYKEFITSGLLKEYFNGSVSNLVSHFSKREQLSAADVEALLKIINQQQKAK